MSSGYGLDLSKATEQEVFDHVVNHLYSQGGQCIGVLYSSEDDEVTEGCAYRNKSGMACAAGCLIFDEDYDPVIENVRWMNVTGTNLPPKYQYHESLIVNLQAVHDCYHDSPVNGTWKEYLNDKFESIANYYNLEFKPR